MVLEPILLTEQSVAGLPGRRYLRKQLQGNTEPLGQGSTKINGTMMYLCSGRCGGKTTPLYRTMLSKVVSMSVRARPSDKAYTANIYSNIFQHPLCKYYVPAWAFNLSLAFKACPASC